MLSRTLRVVAPRLAKSTSSIVFTARQLNYGLGFRVLLPRRHERMLSTPPPHINVRFALDSLKIIQSR